MADAYEYVTLTGVIVPDTSDLLAEVQTEFKSAFGTDLIVTPDTPQGVLITAETLARDAVVRNNAALANQINPNIAGGVFLDAIGALTALERDAATKSVVSATLTGVPATSIPAGVRAKTTGLDLFELTSTVVLDGAGTATGVFQSVEFGPIGCGIGALNQIVDAVLGWETITNPAAGELGRNEQSDQNYRALRKLTLAIQGVALPEAIISALYNTPEVKSLSFRENTAATTQVIDGISMIAHSVYACVDGGTDIDVATALLENKSLGAGWNGAVSVAVVEPVSGQSYVVKFDRPTPIPILIRMNVRVNSILINPVTAAKASILKYANGEMEGERGFVVGGAVSAFELASAVNIDTPGIYVQLLETSDDGGATWDTAEIPIALNEKATTDDASITVTVVA